MKAKAVLSFVLAISLVLAGCAVPQAAPAAVDANQLLSIAQQDTAFLEAERAFSESGVSLMLGSASASVYGDGFVLGVAASGHEYVMSVYFDASKDIEAVIVVRLVDASGFGGVANVTTGRSAVISEDTSGELVATLVGSSKATTSLETLLSVEPALLLQCAACQRALEDLQAAERTANSAWGAVAAAQLAVIIACTIPGPQCIAAWAALAALVAIANNASSEVGRMSGYYNDCVAQNC